MANRVQIEAELARVERVIGEYTEMSKRRVNAEPMLGMMRADVADARALLGLPDGEWEVDEAERVLKSLADIEPGRCVE